MTAHKWPHIAFLIWTLAVTSPVIPATVQPQLLDIFRHFADQSYFSRQYACSERERECFDKGQLLFEEDQQCYAVGERGPCQPHEIFHADKTEADRLGGHLRGTCSTKCEDISKAPLAATGQCMSREEVEEQVCRSEWYLTPTRDAFGQWVCQWTKLPCPPPDYPHRTSPHGGPNSGPYTGVCSVPDIFRRVGANNTEEPTDPLSPIAPADHPWMQFFPNKSYLNREFPCSEEEKICLQFGRVPHSDGNCYRPGEWTRKCESGQSFHIDWDEAMRENGTLRGTCLSRCPGSLRPQEGTGECSDYARVEKQICRFEWGMLPSEDPFGQLVCRCRWKYPDSRPPPSLSPPASTPGHCRAPDFSNPILLPSYDKTLFLGFRLPCSEEEFACLREGRVLAGGACHALRTQGPCAEGEELLLDKEALAHQRLATVCKARPCPEGSLLLPNVGKCLTREKVTSLLCPKQMVALDEFGGWQCDHEGLRPGDLTRVFRHSSNGTCELPPKYAHPLVHGIPPGVPLHRGTKPPSTNFAV